MELPNNNPTPASLSPMLEPQKARGEFLTAWLSLTMIADSFAAFRPLVPVFRVYSVVFSIFLLICTIAIWNWKKWGLYGAVTVRLISFAVNLASGTSTSFALLRLLGFFILIALVQPKWKYFL
jgi:hypothetical protein